MTEDKKTTKKTVSKKSAPKKPGAQTKKAQPTKAPAKKKPASSTKPKLVDETIEKAIASAASVIDKESEKLHQEMVEVIESVINRTEANVPETITVNIQAVAVKSWIRKFFNKIRLTSSKNK